MSDRRRSDLARLLPLVVLVALAAAVALTFGDRLTLEGVRQNRAALLAFRDAHYPLAAAGFVLAYAAVVGLSLPGATVATLTGGFLFGLFPGILFNLCAATAGACAIFLAARHGFGARLEARLGASRGTVRRLHEGLRRNEIEMLLVMRLLPVVPFFVANLVPALLNVRLGRFAATTFIGIVPGTLIYTWLGAGLGQVLAGGARPDLGVIFRPWLLGPILGLAGLVALTAVVRARRRAGEGEEAE